MNVWSSRSFVKKLPGVMPIAFARVLMSFTWTSSEPLPK